jgi:hypothetical protein
MKHLFAILFFVPAVVALTACKSALVLVSGVRQPGIESVTSISRYLERKKIDHFDTSYVCCDSAALYRVMFRVKDFPTTLLFNRLGSSIILPDTGYCPGKAEVFIRNLSPSTVLITDNRFSLDEFRQWLVPVEWHHGTGQQADVTLIVFWAQYFGSLNNNAFRVMKALADNSQVNSRIFLVNVDYMESWHLKSKPEISIK